MAMSASEIEKLIKDAFPDADVEITDLAGDNDHYAAMVSSAAFKGKSRVQQHQMVYEALKGRMGGVLARAVAADQRRRIERRGLTPPGSVPRSLHCPNRMKA